MKDENKVLLGKILGEIYRMQNQMNMVGGASSSQIYGLLNGFEESIEHELEMIGYVSKTQFDAVGEILDEVFTDEEKMKEFKGFYDLEKKFKERGVDRGQANKIIRHYYADDRFIDLIDKMDSSDSPSESRTFKLRDREK